MDHFKALRDLLLIRVITLLLVVSIVPAAVWYAGEFYTDFEPVVVMIATLASGVILAVASAFYIIDTALEPLKNIRQAILHVSHESAANPAPVIEKIRTGREMVAALVVQVYDMASRANHDQQISKTTAPNDADKILNATPLPMITVDSASVVRFINDAALVYLGATPTDRASYIGKNCNDVLNLSFQSEQTYEKWLADCQKNVVKASTSWTRVRLINNEGAPLRQFDLAASYSKGAGSTESVLVMFDHTESYAADDQEISFVAMAVHELRTPLTIMRGYIEVFEDELGPQLPPDLKDFMFKMNASAQQLTAFVSNILNVARVEENQLTLTLHKEDLSAILTSAVQDLELRARVHGKHIQLAIAPNVPMVAADRISVHEVINNLVDNAIKYGGSSDTIKITSQIGNDGMIETSVQDFGLGIPASVVPKLFDKFYRSHRSRVQIGGTGLGLYLCKAIVSAHGGNIWVNTKEGEGSTFTFTLEAYDEQRHGAEAHGQDGIMRGAHGWIKNHSMYRR